jgi:diguanylate cyclase (GGDEF)-like protein/PAS domain S-box-containing protein
VNQDRDKYLTIFDIIPNPAFLLDVENRIENFNNAAFEHFRHMLPAGADFFGKAKITDILPWLTDKLDAFLSGEAPETTFEKDVETRTGLVHFQVRLKRILDLYEKFMGTIVILNDISFLKQAERAVIKARDFYLTLFEEFPTMIWRAGLDGRLNYVNRAWLLFTEGKLEEEIGEDWAKRVHENDVDRFLKLYNEAVQARKPFETEFRLRRLDGRYRWVLGVGRPFNDLEGEFAGFIGACQDIDERKSREEDLSRQATHDSLTGLPNRRVMQEALPRVAARAGRGVDSVVLVLDLDRFKNVNDAWGHDTGDKVLIEVGAILKTQLRAGDLMIRWGGDEFAVLFEDTGIETARAIAQRLCESLAGHDFFPEREGFRLTLSVGLAQVREGDIQEMILIRADKAMYRAKELGGNTIVTAE